MREGFYEDKLIFDPLIPRNTTIPAERSKIYMPYHQFQTQVLIKVYQGDSTDPALNDFLGEVRLTGLINNFKKKEPFEVTFAYDINGILQVKAKSSISQKQVDTVINTTGVKPKPTVDLTKWEKSPNAKKYRPVIRKAEKLIAGDALGSEELELAVERVKEALMLENEAQAETRREELVDLIEQVGELG
jgi:molecular chaperone DnaK (HSP70)